MQDGGNVQDRDLFMKEMDNLISQNQFGQAEVQLTKYIEKNEADSDAFKKRSNLYLKNGKYIQALHDIEKAMLLDSSMPCCKSSYEHYQIKKGLMRMSNDI
ncbi:unnamed protein product [Paramecium primaurelia]|uniref:Uncharacterized protein n=6 Tax=Paramecium TaxID=5884 RepID=A0EDT8_PARTE|nr:uncharacterized protein GSPATT00025799001 [Paramecium tetraurelia]CAD8090119.1 unnamed protein product [Paramecium primaurelia]CAD8169288.1 unnamed protein product [Paramecium octaurelia]CAD8184056.1 unnamed protein product [Paramecium pentaurelia]CAK93455.1 unnamed protein product [Paramecium tetraurelia]|eukprot:XP_001460852.1 hypothetical protein (macronuclear) [Paramecium tetraurelia strain d4-2]